ncbi:MAG: hypothetical protein U9P81_10290, partial [Euryarchaeota archaeon]|nr:hypothetical protein [Euryarchaeota archaeon]
MLQTDSGNSYDHIEHSIILNSNDSYYADQPQINNNKVVWTANDGNDYEIYYWNGTLNSKKEPSEIIKISNNSYRDNHPKINAGGVVWIGYENMTSHIFYWDGTFNLNGTPIDPIKLSNDNLSVINPD